jgi:hypothetical protein
VIPELSSLGTRGKCRRSRGRFPSNPDRDHGGVEEGDEEQLYPK